MRPRAVLDTNVLLGPDRNTLVFLAQKGIYRMVWSSYGIAELARVFTRMGYHNNQGDGRIAQTLNSYIDALSRVAVYAEYTRLTDMNVPGLPDPDDEPFLATAIVGNARYVVSDNTRHFPPPHLNPFPASDHPFRRIRYITGKDFIAEMLEAHPRFAGQVASGLPRP